MHPLFEIADLDHPPVTLENHTDHFFPFDPTRLNWLPGATDQQRRQALAFFDLALSYTANSSLANPTPLFLPFPGLASFREHRAGGALMARTLIINFGAELVQTLFLGGLDVSAARLLITFSAAQDERLRAELSQLYTQQKIIRRWFDESDLLSSGQEVQVVDLPQVADEMENRRRRMATWLDGTTATTWEFGSQDEPIRLLGLAAGEKVKLQVMVKGKPGGDWWFINPALILHLLQIAGDLRQPDNARLEKVLIGENYGLVGSYGQTPDNFQEVNILFGGSKDSVVLLPARVPSADVPPGLFSFTTADEIHLFSPCLENQPVQLACEQPTLDTAAMTRLKELIKKQDGTPKRRNYYNANNADKVFIPGVMNGPNGQLSPPVFLASEHGVYATSLPDDEARLYQLLPEVFGYDMALHRRKDRAASSDWQRDVLINAENDLRPQHPVWQKQRHKQLRVLFPLRLRINAFHLEVTLTQDEVDCIRQEYIFHLQWADRGDGHYYYQPDIHMKTPQHGKTFSIPANDHLPGQDSQSLPIPVLGRAREVRLPERKEVVPITPAMRKNDRVNQMFLARYRYTRLIPNWQRFLEALEQRVGECSDYISQLLAALAAGQPAPASPANLFQPDVLREVTTRIYHLLQANGQTPFFSLDSVDGFLQFHLAGHNSNGKTALDQFNANRNRLWVSSAWRPPEHNETSSVTPASNHQVGEAMDIQPVNGGSKNRNPLVLLGVHHTSQELNEQGHLREVLLENGPTEFVTGPFNHPLSGKVFTEETQNGVTKYYECELTPAGPQNCVEINGSTTMDEKLLVQFRKQFNATPGGMKPWPDPPPTVLDLYIFALAFGSHVHFTLKDSYIQLLGD